MVPLKHSELPPRFKKAIMIVRAQCHCEKNNRREEETSRLMDAQPENSRTWTYTTESFLRETSPSPATITTKATSKISPEPKGPTPKRWAFFIPSPPR